MQTEKYDGLQATVKRREQAMAGVRTGSSVRVSRMRRPTLSIQAASHLSVRLETTINRCLREPLAL